MTEARVRSVGPETDELAGRNTRLAAAGSRLEPAGFLIPDPGCDRRGDHGSGAEGDRDRDHQRSPQDHPG